MVKIGYAWRERNWPSGSDKGDAVTTAISRWPAICPMILPSSYCACKREFEERAAAFSFAGSKGMVLDAGCGNGELLIAALEMGIAKENGARFIGMDFSANMLGRAKLRTSGDPRTAFLQGSITSLPFVDRSFNWVVSSGVLTCLATPQSMAEALQEFNRVLCPGGGLVVDFFTAGVSLLFRIPESIGECRLSDRRASRFRLQALPRLLIYEPLQAGRRPGLSAGAHLPITGETDFARMAQAQSFRIQDICEVQKDIDF